MALHKLFPKAPLYTSVYDEDTATWAKTFDVRTSFLQDIPFAKQNHRQFLPLMPSAFESFDLSEFDCVISITSAEAKGVVVSPNTFHICYLLTPTRYLWSHTYEYQTGVLKPLKAFVFSILRRWDYKVAQNLDVIIPISKLVQVRTEKYYRRQTEPVIYPPFSLSDTVLPKQNTVFTDKEYFLAIARMVSYKKIPLCIQACVEMKKQLVLIGDGPQASEVEQAIQKFDPEKKFVHWFKSVSDQDLAQAYSHAKAFLLPAEEDFGITALEAQAHGRPVIVYHRSGAAETVIDQTTGIHFIEQNVTHLKKAMQMSEAKHWDSDVIKLHATQYNEQKFLAQFETAVKKAWTKHLSSQKGTV
jgi:glycosyltransferase involved in cell wall biosynthesis